MRTSNYHRDPFGAIRDRHGSTTDSEGVKHTTDWDGTDKLTDMGGHRVDVDMEGHPIDNFDYDRYLG